MAQAVEQVLVQQLVPHSSVEAFDEAVLHGLARRDIVPLDLPVLLPFQDGIRGQFGPVVADHHAGVAPHLGDPVQFAANPIPDNDVSTTAARHSRLKSSITFRIRKRRPQDRLSDTKSKLHRWFCPCGTTIGDLVRKARFLPPRRRTVRPSSLYMR